MQILLKLKEFGIKLWQKSASEEQIHWEFDESEFDIWNRELYCDLKLWTSFSEFETTFVENDTREGTAGIIQ